ncbi:MAG UNVERIFIED_CONTAM: hypothetical protein LVT10_17385 [Anaerolineae bacterium]|jgi:hypothetical protein
MVNIRSVDVPIFVKTMMGHTMGGRLVSDWGTLERTGDRGTDVRYLFEGVNMLH